MQYIYIYIIFLFLEAQDGEKRRAENGRTEASAPTGMVQKRLDNGTGRAYNDDKGIADQRLTRYVNALKENL